MPALINGLKFDIQLITVHATTVLALIHQNKLCMAADGQATLGNTIAKANVRKLRKLADGAVVCGFAGSTADAFTLLERFEEKLSAYSNNLKRASIELAKDWRTDRYLRRLEAMLIVSNTTDMLILSGTGDVIEPEHQIAAIGSGANFALSAALALKKNAPHLSARQIVEESMHIAADICIYTNHNIVFEEI